MKKEVLLAISIGFALGLVITFGIWTANKSLAGLKNTKPNPSPTVAAQVTPIANPTISPVPTSGNLILTSPEDEAFSSKNTTTVAGKTTPGATIVILYEGDDDVLLADASGNFTDDIDLIAGFNNITVSAFDAQGNKSTQTLVVTYSTAKI